MKEELLPVGSVVGRNENFLFMIIGYFPNKIASKEKYDYICCKMPGGIKKEQKKMKLYTDYTYMKKEDIKVLKFIGYSDKEFDLYEKVHNKIEQINVENNNEIQAKDLEEMLKDIGKEVKSSGD